MSIRFEVVGYSGILPAKDMVRPLTSDRWRIQLNVSPKQSSLPDVHKKIQATLRLTEEGNIQVGPGNLVNLANDIRRIEEEWGFRKPRFKYIG